MALKPTIYKFTVSLSNLELDHYDDLSLTVAKHPSESAERMTARLIAFCLNAQERLAFTRGLSDTEEPDLWVRSLDDQIDLWIEVGEPSLDRIKKATRRARDVRVYSFNSKSPSWWQNLQLQRSKLKALVVAFDWESIQALAAMLERTMVMSVTITGESAFVATAQGECEVTWRQLSL